MVAKNIVITGGGTGTGRETVQAYALAGATSVHVLGRTESTLVETKNIVEKDVPGVIVSVHSADVMDETAVRKAASEVGSWDVLVPNAGYLSKRKSIQEVDLDDWWLGFETIVKGSIIVARAFLPSRDPNASLLAVSSAVFSLPAEAVEGGSSHAISKLARVKQFEFVVAEYPDVQVLTIHTGVIDTAMNQKSGFGRAANR